MKRSLKSYQGGRARGLMVTLITCVVLLAPAITVGDALAGTGRASVRLRARSTPVYAGTPLGCLMIGGLINTHKSGRSVWEGFDMAYSAWVSVHGPYRTTAVAASAARHSGRGGFAESVKKYVVSAPMGKSLEPQVKTVGACLTERVHRVGYTF